MSELEMQSYGVAVADESQESQSLLEKYVSEFGIPGLDFTAAKAQYNGTGPRPTMRSSHLPSSSGGKLIPDKVAGSRGGPAAEGDTKEAGIAGPALDDAKTSSSNIPTPPEPQPITISSSPTSQRKDITTTNRGQGRATQRRVAIDLENAHDPIRLPPPMRAPRTMDISQSPTQANDDRDYETACNVLTSSDQPASNHSDAPRTLQEGDTGAVNFGPLSQDGKDISQDSDILSPFSENPVLQRGDWRGQRASQRYGMTPARPSMAAPPETPAGPVNPFAARQKPASVLRATQMFNATQFSSGGGAGKKFSPTSSRPSPHAFHHTFPADTSPGLLTSPIKNRLASSPSIFRKSSPLINVPSTSFAEPARTPPMPGSPRDEEAIPESPTCELDLAADPDDAHDHEQSPSPSPPRKKQRRELLEEYEPVEASQQRKLASEDLPRPVSDIDSDEDDELRRRRRARQRRDWAERKLRDISFEPPAKTGAANSRATAKQRRMRRGGAFFHGSTDELNPSDHAVDGRRPSSAAGRRLETPSNVRFASVPPREHDSVDTRLNMTSPVDAPDASDGIHGPFDEDQVRIPVTSPPPALSPTQTTTDEVAELQPSSPPPKPTRDLESSHAQSSVVLPAQLPPTSSGISKRYGLRHATQRTSSRVLVPESPMVVPESDIVQDALVSEDDPGDDTVLAPVQEDEDDAPQELPPIEDDLPSTQPPSSAIPPTKAQSRRRGGPVEKPAEAPVEEPAEESADATTTEPTEERATPPQSIHPATRSSTRTAKKPQSPLSELSSTPSMPQSPRETASSISKNDLYDLPASSAAEPPVPKSVRAPLLRRTYGKVRRTLRLTRNSLASSKQQPDIHEIDSTDELAKSPSRAPLSTSSAMVSRTNLGRSARFSESTSTNPATTNRALLFDNMAFAISFQAQRDGETSDEYKERCSMSEELADLVVRAGGRILTTGFNELLDAPTLKPAAAKATGAAEEAEGGDDAPLKLDPEARGLGFTALLADGHSRKVKYMQALALGLPCLAYQWASACLDKGEVLDWSPYLLCAGQSVCAGNAILSRHLAPYSAIGAALEDAVAQRRELLGGDRILLVMKKSRAEESKMAYLVLARILGAKLTRAHSVRDARVALRQSEARDSRFDWVYVDEETGSAEQLFGEAGAGANTGLGPGGAKGGGSRKRKRARGKQAKEGAASAAAAVEEGPAPGRVRCLSNELVIQSLIMGRIIDEDERALNVL